MGVMVVWAVHVRSVAVPVEAAAAVSEVAYAVIGGAE